MGDEFQCSSASRKFLKCRITVQCAIIQNRFSALQRAENSSKLRTALLAAPLQAVSVLFSEPKIPQTKLSRSPVRNSGVSVLFSEPKIPQTFRFAGSPLRFCCGFQCSSASRKFLKRHGPNVRWLSASVSVLFSEPKIPQCQRANDRQQFERLVSVLFSEPKIPQSYPPQVS